MKYFSDCVQVHTGAEWGIKRPCPDPVSEDNGTLCVSTGSCSDELLFIKDSLIVNIITNI